MSMKRLLLSALLMMLAISWTVSATATTKIPKVMNFQGYLTDASGTPINGTRNLRFRLYDAVSGGNALNWNETHSSVPITNGIYNVMLGNSGSPTPRALNETFREQYYLEIQVDHTGSGGWEIMSPRHPLANASYALAARKIVYQQVLTVAADGGDTTTVCGAIDMLLGQGAFTGAAYGALSPAPSASTPWVIDVQAGQFNEQAGTFGAGAGTIALPNYVTIRGQGWNATELINVNSVDMTGTRQGLESLMIIPNSNTTAITLAGSMYCYVRAVKIEQMEATPAIDMSGANYCEVIENHLFVMGPGSATGIITAGMTNSRVEDNVIDLTFMLAAWTMGSAGITDNGTAMTTSTILENTILYNTTGIAGPGPSYGIGLSGAGTNVQVSGNIFQLGTITKDIVAVGTGNPPTWTAPGAGEHGTDNQRSDGTTAPVF
ncbi:hypothetical protein K8S19_07940 [bacterium]|nr:hypothetical protein [bacterium]